MLQDDLVQLSLCSKTLQLNFNVKKCYYLGTTCKKFPILFQFAWLAYIPSQLYKISWGYEQIHIPHAIRVHCIARRDKRLQ